MEVNEGNSSDKAHHQEQVLENVVTEIASRMHEV
jgi:hypothetical protein